MKNDERRRSARRKHSYVPFYFDDWNGGTSDMPRLVWSVYFQVCKYSWDKAAPVPAARLMTMLADIEPQGTAIVNALVEEGRLIRDEATGAVYCERALEEGQIALSLWERKSAGGRTRQEAGARKQSSSTPDSTQGENHSRSIPEPEPERREEESPLPPAGADDEKPVEPESKRPGRAECIAVMDAWNAMAELHDLPKAVKLTDSREKSARCRIEDYGIEKITAALALVPDRAFLLGDNERNWRADFEWFVRPDSIAKVLEGNYAAGNGGGKPSGWRDA